MTRTETISIMSVLKAAYPVFYRGMTPRDAEAVVDLWQSMFRDDPVELVAVATKALIASDKTGYPPHIGAVKDKIRQLVEPESMTEAEAWGKVYKAIKRSSYGAEEEYQKLPKMLQRLVGSPSQLRDWAMMDSDTVQSVVASNFQRAYKVRAKEAKDWAAIPPDVKVAIEGIANRLALDKGLDA